LSLGGVPDGVTHLFFIFQDGASPYLLAAVYFLLSRSVVSLSLGLLWWSSFLSFLCGST